MALLGAETWTLWKVDQKQSVTFVAWLCEVLKLGHYGKWIRSTWKAAQMWCWRRMEKISRTGRVRNEEVLRTVREVRFVLRTEK